MGSAGNDFGGTYERARRTFHNSDVEKTLISKVHSLLAIAIASVSIGDSNIHRGARLETQEFRRLQARVSEVAIQELMTIAVLSVW